MYEGSSTTDTDRRTSFLSTFRGIQLNATALAVSTEVGNRSPSILAAMLGHGLRQQIFNVLEAPSSKPQALNHKLSALVALEDRMCSKPAYLCGRPPQHMMPMGAPVVASGAEGLLKPLSPKALAGASSNFGALSLRGMLSSVQGLGPSHFGNSALAERAKRPWIGNIPHVCGAS